MQYTQLTDNDVRQMLDRIGIESIDALFQNVPKRARLDRPLCLPAAMTEPELIAHLGALAGANHGCDELTCFLGGGAYDHFIPTVVDALAGQSEFVTAYTPYQAEASQGALQAFFEYQTLICQLTGMDVSNASLYDGATATAEAALMARGANGRRRLIVSGGVHPDTRRVLETYLRELPMELEIIETPTGLTDPGVLRKACSDETTAVVVQSPNFFGCVESLERLAAVTHDAGAPLIASVDPIACGLLKLPGACGVDIAVGEGQPLGIPLGWGGPYLGFMAVREAFMRKLPGRLVGATRDTNGRRSFCLTLQTREQHIRRERATSNVCTNQGLLALRATIYLSAVGRTGIANVASLCLSKAHYAAERIAALDRFELAFAAPFFKEFVVRTRKDVGKVLQHARQHGILAGVALGRWHEALRDCFLVAVTEKRTRAQIDALVAALKEA
ncbi:MAG: aminomethyl-transferring glycine dehydrogenase subunit GcvPA [Phycisphaerae bacterium]|nr:aminomethyl-transferring glycine dehydrogenase subunit GcvPA [Phycisphaerae bacterium]